MAVLIHTYSDVVSSILTLLSRATICPLLLFGAKKQTMHSISYCCVIIILSMTCQPQLSMHGQCITSTIYAWFISDMWKTSSSWCLEGCVMVSVWESQLMVKKIVVKQSLVQLNIRVIFHFFVCKMVTKSRLKEIHFITSHRLFATIDIE